MCKITHCILLWQTKLPLLCVAQLAHAGPDSQVVQSASLGGWDAEACRGQLCQSANPAKLSGVSLRLAVSVERHRCLQADSLRFRLLRLRCCKHPQDRKIDIKIPSAVVAISVVKVSSDTPQIFLVSALEHYSSSLGKGKRDLHTLSISWTLSLVFPVLPFFLADLAMRERRRMDNDLLHKDFFNTYKMLHRFLPGSWT